MRTALLCLTFLALPAAAQIVYSFPPLPDTPQDRAYRTQTEAVEAARRVLAAYSDPALAELGILDVTKAPYNAKGDGKADDTAALQRAIKDARDARLVTWLPAGTYLVRDTIQCVQHALQPSPLPRTSPEERLRGNDYPCIIRGASTGRATIRLAPGTAGFDDANRPKPVLLIWARAWTEPYDLAPNVSFNQAALSLDFDLRGNPGAIALDLQGAQGAVVEDISIDAAGAFAGLRGLQGSGGSTAGLTVRGGRYGVYAAGIGPYSCFTGSQPSPLLLRATLLDQSVAAIEYAGRGPLTVVGARVRGAGLICRGSSQPYNGALSVIESVLEVTSGPAVRSDRPVYLNRCWIRGAAPLLALAGEVEVKPAGSAWTVADEVAAAPSPAASFPIWVDGKRQNGPLLRTSASTAEPPEDLLTRHDLPRLPAWDDPAAINPRQEPFLAKGDGVTDDTRALQAAIDRHRVVFLPKGRYKISRPLRLRPETVLFGVGGVYSELTPIAGAPAYADPSSANPLVETADDGEAETSLSNLQLRALIPGAYALHWRAGRRSVVRDVSFHRFPASGTSTHPHILIDGNGGGRWYNVNTGQASASAPTFRHQLVRGTRQPLTFYMFNPEHSRSDANSDFLDVANVTFYGVKGETFEIGNHDGGTRPLLRFRDSRNFRIFGVGGIVGVAAGWPKAVIEIDRCGDFLLSNFGHQKDYSDFAPYAEWSTVRDGELALPAHEHFVLYRKGSPE